MGYSLLFTHYSLVTRDFLLSSLLLSLFIIAALISSSVFPLSLPLSLRLFLFLSVFLSSSLSCLPFLLTHSSAPHPHITRININISPYFRSHHSVTSHTAPAESFRTALGFFFFLFVSFFVPCVNV